MSNICHVVVLHYDKRERICFQLNARNQVASELSFDHVFVD